MPSYDSLGRLKIVNANSTSTGSGGAIAIASGSNGTIVDADATFINLKGSAISSVVTSGSGVAVNIDHVRYTDFLTGFGEGSTDAERNAWQMSFDPLSGSTNWTVGVLFTRTSWDNGEDEQRLWSTSNQFLAGGGATFSMANNGTIPTLYFTQGGLQTNAASGENFFRSRTLFAVCRYTGGDTLQYMDGYFNNGAQGSDTGVAYDASGYPFTVGASGEPSNIYGAEDYGIHSIAYITRSLSQTEILDWWRHVYVSGTIVDIPNAPGNGLNGAWRVTAGVNPSGTTWLPFIGADNLVKTGTKAHATSSLPLIW